MVFCRDLARMLLHAMTLFSNSPADWQRLDWQILRDAGAALYWWQEYFTDDVACESDDIYDCDCERWRSEEEMYSDIGPVLRFSEWRGPESGHNINALDDCLTDLRARNEVRAGEGAI
jgi:hypothetical protein